MVYRRPVRELVRARRACRTFDRAGIPDDARHELELACASQMHGLWNEGTRFQLIDRGPQPGTGAMSLFVPGARCFLVGTVRDADRARVSYGFRMEELVLKATELGLGTCWLGMVDPAAFPGLEMASGEIAPAVCAVGPRSVRPRLLERLIRFVISAGTRRPWSELFFDEALTRSLTPVEAGPYAEPLEMLRWAPSAGNRQPWRVVRESGANVFHFFARPTRRAYARRRLHELDLGIAMCHFELSARENGQEGTWVLRQAQDPVLREGQDPVLRQSQDRAGGKPGEMVYIATWLDSRAFPE